MCGESDWDQRCGRPAQKSGKRCGKKFSRPAEARSYVSLRLGERDSLRDKSSAEKKGEEDQRNSGKLPP